MMTRFLTNVVAVGLTTTLITTAAPTSTTWEEAGAKPSTVTASRVLSPRADTSIETSLTQSGGTTPSRALDPRIDTPFRWPVPEPAVVVRPFVGPAQKWSPGHRGVDLFAPPGTAVLAPADGVVTFVGFVVDRHLIVITHGELRSTLEPITTTLTLGTQVTQGQVVGIVSDEPAHAPDVVHWGVRRGDVYLDPALLVHPAPRAVLLK